MKNITKCLLMAYLLLAFGFTAFAQKPGTADYLLVKRGFKIFKLGESIEKYSKYVKVLPDTPKNRYEVIDTNMLSVGKDIKLKKIVLYIKNNLISDIYVLLDSEYNEKFLATLMAAYGDYHILSKALEFYFWDTSNKKIKLTYYDKYKDNQSLAMFSLEKALTQ